MKIQRFAAVGAMIALLVVSGSPVAAAGLAKGSSILSFEIADGDGDFITPESGSGGVTAYDHSEWGGQLQYQYLVSEDWAMAASFGVGTFKEKDTPGTNASPSDPTFTYKQSSWQVRLGADRFVHLSETFHLFCGPGLHVWSGKAKFTDATATTSTTVESESTTRVALDGRIGAHIGLGSSVALVGELGRYVGHASGKDAGAKAAWWPSGNHGAMGLAVSF
jgi:hypothetical protein